MLGLALALAAAIAACSTGAGGEAPAGSSPGASATGLAARPVGTSPWSRDAAPNPAEGAEADAGPSLPSSADPEALDELIHAAPRDAGSPTGEDGGTRIGSDTHEPLPDGGGTEAAAGVPATARRPRIGVGEATVQPGMSSPAIERAARAQLYWPLTQRCRDKEGKILPPDVVTLEFTIDREGYISGSSIVASARDPKYDEAAQCMRRELSAATFVAPASARGVATRITATIPSVD